MKFHKPDEKVRPLEEEEGDGGNLTGDLLVWGRFVGVAYLNT